MAKQLSEDTGILEVAASQLCAMVDGGKASGLGSERKLLPVGHDDEQFDS